MDGIRVALLDPARADDGALADELAALVNLVYATSEDGLWRDGAARTNAGEVAALIGAGEIAVAWLGDRVAGAVRIRALTDATGEFGMLAASPELRGIGIGSALVAFAERRCADRGLRTMQLELLVPRRFAHPSKVRLDRWYRRLGYRVLRSVAPHELEPRLASFLATPCEFLVYEKPLAP